MARHTRLSEAAQTLRNRIQAFGSQRRTFVALQDEVRNEQRLIYSPLRISRLEQAIDGLERRVPPSRDAIEDSPAELDFYIGNALFHLGRLPDAVASWRASIEKNHAFPQAYQNLAVGYWLMGDLVGAVRAVGDAAKFGLSVDPRLKADLLAAARTSSPR